MVNVVAMAAAPDERVPGVTTSAVPSNKEVASDPKGRKTVGSLARPLALLVAIVLVSLMIKVIGVENGNGVPSRARPLT